MRGRGEKGAGAWLEIALIPVEKPQAWSGSRGMGARLRDLAAAAAMLAAADAGSGIGAAIALDHAGSPAIRAVGWRRARSRPAKPWSPKLWSRKARACDRAGRSAARRAIRRNSGRPGRAGGERALRPRLRRSRSTPTWCGASIRCRPDQSGAFRPLKEEKSATPTFALPPGDYVVHVTFGLASAAKTVHLKSEVTREVFELPAGGLRLEGRVGDVRIPPGQISFDVFRGSQFEPGDKRPIAPGVATGDVVVLPEGTYHIVSNYGDSNSIVRSDIRVQAGKLTDVTVTHRAAVITLKLVSERGGEALANTNWSVLTPGGDVIKESIGAFPKVILAEGDYRAIARNDGKTYEREFKVITGVDGEIEVLAR